MADSYMLKLGIALRYTRNARRAVDSALGEIRAIWPEHPYRLRIARIAWSLKAEEKAIIEMHLQLAKMMAEEDTDGLGGGS